MSVRLELPSDSFPRMTLTAPDSDKPLDLILTCAEGVFPEPTEPKAGIEKGGSSEHAASAGEKQQQNQEKTMGGMFFSHGLSL